MGRSTSCFKIITCASDSADQDDLQTTERKGSNDKRGWSFRKRSSSHRVLSNTVISEPHSSGNKQSPEPAAVNFQATTDSSAPEKISVLQWPDEKPELSTPVVVTDTIVAIEDESKVSSCVEESVVVVIQTAIRGSLARSELVKLQNVVKLQAAVRGHLVRRQAVGTLRCVQAIVKMQALVRARQAHLLFERSYIEEKTKEKHEKGDHAKKFQEKRVSARKPEISYVSIDKLLSNRFARQLLDSTPKSKAINIKCDTSRPNSAWNWLERWMYASSPDIAESQKPDSSTELGEQEKVNQYSSPEENEKSSKLCESAESKPSGRELAVAVENEENSVTCKENNGACQACLPPSSSDNDRQQHTAEITSNSDARESSFEIDSFPNLTVQSSANSETDSLPAKLEIESAQPTHSMKRFVSEQPQTEKTLVPGSRKASNPAFIAAQSKFKELSTSASSVRSKGPSLRDVPDSNISTASSGADAVSEKQDINEAENASHHNSNIQVGGSECGTELSISSTLDTMDRSDAGDIEIQPEGKVSEDTACLPHDTRDSATEESPDMSAHPVQQHKPDNIDGESVSYVVDVDPIKTEQKPDRNESNLQRELDSERGNQAYRSSPEASPRSHATFPDSQGTPSSQLSTKPKRSKTNKSGSNRKETSLTVGKRSPLNSNHDSGSRNSVEQLPKDQKAAKRRSSFGSARPDLVDSERRDSSSSNSLPSYMQATESARAKAYANNSPRSSPDVSDKDIYNKKRHSLPGANGKHGSPRIQQSPPQMQLGAKGNGAPPQERKWQR